MNILLTIGLLLLTGYSVGLLLNKIGLPKIVGYIITGIAFSPKINTFVAHDIAQSTEPLMQVCLAFIAFEVGGSLRWSTIQKHEKEIISITLLASFIPFVLIVGGVYAMGILLSNSLPIDHTSLIFLALLLGALASPTAPAATLAVIHQYKAKGKVTDTIMGVAALDDVIGILLFSFTIGIISIFTAGFDTFIGNPILNAIYQIVVAISIGAIIAFCIDFLSRIFMLKSDGQWIVIITALIIFCAGISKLLHVDELLSCMTMGVVVVNKCKHEKPIFRILERYTEDLIFLVFFLLSGLHLDITSLPQATALIALFVVLRTIGKYLGANWGARFAHADKTIQKYTAGGLLPQAGIVIGLVLSVYQVEAFSAIADILLATIMGATVIHEIIGPIAAKYSLAKAGEIGKHAH